MKIVLHFRNNTKCYTIQRQFSRYLNGWNKWSVWGNTKGAEEITKLAGGKYQIAKYIFKAEGISISVTYGYGGNDGDIVKTGVNLVFETLLSSGIPIAIVSALSVTYTPYLVIIAGILMNTQIGKLVVDGATQDK